jgi:signal recognition particle subunit SRP54
MDALDDFHPSRIANRILGMGDIVSLVEKAAQNIDAEKAKALADKMRKGKFDLEDLRDQLSQIEKIGGVGGLLGMLPGIAKMKDQIASANLDQTVVKRQKAIIDSMTRGERRNPDLLKASRKKRIAAGSGTKVEDINRLLKMHRQTADMMKAMGQSKRGPMAGMAQMFGLGGGIPSAEEIAKLQAQAGAAGGALPEFPGAAGVGSQGLPKLPAGFPGLGGKGMGLPGGLPGLGGFNPFGGKKK